MAEPCRQGENTLDRGFLIQFAVSAAAVAGLVVLSAWARIARPTPPLDEAQARTLLDEEFPGQRPDEIWIAQDGAGALARSGASALILWRIGDGYVARATSWARVLEARLTNGRLRIDFDEAAAPRAVLAMADWPPQGATA